MKKYKVVLEVMFVRVKSEATRYGFFATFFLDAATAQIALDRARQQLTTRMDSLRIEPVAHGILHTRVLVSDIWVIEEQIVPKRMDGVSLYEIGPINCIKALTHYFHVLLFKRYYVVPMVFDENRQTQP